MKETSKCHDIRLQRGDFDNYIKGSIIDIGSGPDPIRPPNGTVRAWDLRDGDGMLLQSISDSTVDCVYSSHCLEHLKNIRIALVNWLRVLKPGGYLYFTVPDFKLYEKEQWPSKFNADHKFSFSLDKTKSSVGRENHVNIQQDLVPLLGSLDCSLISATLEDFGFDYTDLTSDQTMKSAVAQICVIARKNA